MVLLIEIMFASACTFTKLSMLMLVRRMLTSATIFWRRVTLAAICIVGLQGALFCIVLVFQCRLVKIIAFSFCLMCQRGAGVEMCNDLHTNTS